MKGWRLRIALALLTLAAVAVAGCSGGDATKAGGSGAPVTLRIGTYDTPERPGADQIEEFARQVEELSDGKLRIEPVWKVGGEDADDWDQQVARRVVSGELDAGMLPARAWDTEGVTSLRALHAPFLVTSDELLDRIVTSELADRMLAGLDKAGVVGLALLPEGLRHPFGFGEPLLSLNDYAGALIRTPRSDVAYALFEALGATPDDLIGAPFDEGVADGSVAAAESGFEVLSSLPAATIATANVTFFPKANTLVFNAEVVAGLPEEQRRILAEAAARTLTWAIESTPADTDAAKIFCAQGNAVVLASEAEVAALERAAAPVYAELERDPETKSLIEAIRALKSEVAGSVAAAPTPCDGSSDGGAGTTAAGGTSGVTPIDGIYRAELTEDELLERGLSPTDAFDNSGLIRLTFDRGTLVISEEHGRWADCHGVYSVSGSTLSIHITGPGCPYEEEPISTEWTLEDGELRLVVTEDPANNPFEHVWWGGEPWRLIATVESEEPAFPEGVYRAEHTVEFLIELGIDSATAHDWAAINTLTFEDGRWVHHVEGAPADSDCSGTYSVEGGRISAVLGPGGFGCGTEGALLFSARWTLDGDELRFSELPPGGFPWDAKPWKKIG